MKDTTLASDEGIRSIVEAMKTLRFPKPARGTMRVLYPIQLSPGS